MVKNSNNRGCGGKKRKEKEERGRVRKGKGGMRKIRGLLVLGAEFLRQLCAFRIPRNHEVKFQTAKWGCRT